MPFYRKIVWVVGVEGNEGKSFFQSNVREDFGYSRVSRLELGETAINTYFRKTLFIKYQYLPIQRSKRTVSI